MSISSSRPRIAGRFYEAIGFAVATFGDVKSVTLPEGGNLILMQADSFA
ncbi:hypothetical protein P7J41_06400 [Streptococcus suis]